MYVLLKYVCMYQVCTSVLNVYSSWLFALIPIIIFHTITSSTIAYFATHSTPPSSATNIRNESCNRQNVPNLTILAAVLIKNHRNGRRRNYKAPTFVAARPIDGPRLSSEWRRRGGVAPEEEQGFSHFLLTLETMLVEPWWFHRTIKRKHTQQRRTCAIPFAFGDRSFSCSIRHDRGTNERFLDPPARCPCLASTVSSDRFEGSRCR